MDKYNHYFEMLVTEEIMDNSFNWVEEAMWTTRAATLLARTAGVAHGAIHVGADVVQNAAPDLNVIVEIGACTDPSGRNVQWTSDQTVDCSVDYLGNPTDVGSPGNERYLGIFAFWDQELTDPEVDGNGLTVYSKINESFLIKVYAGTEAGAGLANPPATPADSIRLANVLLSYGMVTILNADIAYDTTNYLRDDYVRVAGVNLADLVYGNASDAIEQLFVEIDTLAVGTGIEFAGLEDWHDASGVLASTSLSDAINEIVEDLAQDTGGEWGSDKIGSEEYSTASGNADLTRGSVSDQIREIADTLDDFIETYGFYYSPPDTYKSMVVSKLWEDSFSRPTDAENTITGGSTKKYVDIKPYFTTDGGPRLLVLDNTNKKIEVWNPKTRTLVITTNALTDDLPSGGSETWQCIAMCTDGTDVYVAFTDTNASPDEHRIQAWTIDVSASDWSVKSGWAATGTALTATGNHSTNQSRDLDIIIASSTKLAVASCCQVITGSSSEAISIIDKSDGSILSEGAGDSTTGSGEEVIGRICSDGTYIYFTVNNGGTPVLCSAAISDATTGSGGTGYPRSLTANSFYGVLCSCGSELIVTSIWEINGLATSSVFHTHNSTNASLQDVLLGQNSAGTPVVSDHYILKVPTDICFDGVNLWILGGIDQGANDLLVLCKIDAAKLHASTLADDLQLNDIIAGSYVVCEVPNTANDLWLTSMTFDGSDLWVLPEPDASQTHSGKIYRLQSTLFRG